jgi:hypothetical protein
MTPAEPTSEAGYVEVLQDRLRRLLRERENLRTVEADRAALERNRRAIVEAQWELSRALIARHHPSFQAA